MTRDARSTVLVVFFAIVAGAWSAVYAIGHWSFESLAHGTWTAIPAYGGASADPYARAKTAGRIDLPLGRDEGMAFAATSDAAGDALRLECTYRVSGTLPVLALWTIAPFSAVPHRPVGLGGRPRALHAREAVYRPDGSVEVTIGPRAEPGNWISTSGDGYLRLVLTLYDLSAGGDTIPSHVALPSITKAGCDA